VEDLDIENFMNQYGVKTTKEERQHILNLVKSKQPTKGIDYQAFLKIFLPKTSKSFT